MWKRKLCLSALDSLGPDISEQIPMIKQVGFDAIFFPDSDIETLRTWAKIAKDVGIEIQSVHAPFNKCDDMWDSDETLGKIAVDGLIDCVHKCSDIGAPIMVSHAFIGFEDEIHGPNDIGLERYGKVVDEAEKYGIKIAFENTEGEEYLEALINAFRDKDHVGFCWDSGHEMCYNHSQDLLAKYGDKLICTHLNDNLGISRFDGSIFWTDDLHLLPFDGIADWDYNARRLNKCGYKDTLTFELNKGSKPNRHENDEYTKMDIINYFTECYKRACRVAAKVENNFHD